MFVNQYLGLAIHPYPREEGCEPYLEFVMYPPTVQTGSLVEAVIG